MGCGSSKNALQHVDDSVHVMLQHDKRASMRKGRPAPGYKPRTEHPLLRPKETSTSADGGAPNGAGAATTNDPVDAAPNGAEAVTANGPIATEEE